MVAMPDAMTSSTCIPNIGPREQRRRIVMGIGMSVLTAAAVVWLVAADAPRVWRLLVFVPAWIAALDFLQVRARTCVLLAARGVRNLDAGIEPIASASERARIRTQARVVHVQAALVATVITAAVAAVP